MVCIECYVIPLVLVAIQWIYTYVAKWLGWEVKSKPATKATPGAVAKVSDKSTPATDEAAAGSTKVQSGVASEPAVSPAS